MSDQNAAPPTFPKTLLISDFYLHWRMQLGGVVLPIVGAVMFFSSQKPLPTEGELLRCSISQFDRYVQKTSVVAVVANSGERWEYQAGAPNYDVVNGLLGTQNPDPSVVLWGSPGRGTREIYQVEIHGDKVVTYAQSAPYYKAHHGTVGTIGIFVFLAGIWLLAGNIVTRKARH